ncbi:MAG TPA: DUF58 domain-containing protein [Bacteroidia bacterium]|nr:MAG: hypothetical protein BWX95_01108 [Bacteroidetes bacterium ADurb.Bin141]HNR49276.1 DUF58 domain-containing protein [Bacteroidia bacterium]HNT82992.1 DUF58 domain-containing protein [Bacteroidia bacterium]
METTDLLKKVRKIEIKTRGLSSQIFSGEYHSAFKGRGMAFSEVREYIPGDDIRAIDWNVTARLNHPYVKVFEEERELTVMLLVDISASGNFGTNKQFKRELITEVCAVLSFSAIQNNDKTGLILFSDKIEKFIPPQKGRSHILRIIRELIKFQPESKGTSLATGLQYLSNVIKKRSIAFIVSDFYDTSFTGTSTKSPFEEALKITSRKHDLVALKINDRRETELPDIGLVRVKNAESGREMIVDTSDATVRKNFKQQRQLHDLRLNTIFSRSGVDKTDLYTGENYIQPLMKLFKKREKR